MRIISPPVQNMFDRNLGTEPILLVEIEWVEGSPILYSDQKINDADYPYPIILSMGGFDTSMALSGSSDSLNLHIKLDDVDGKLKDIYLSNDVHKRPAKIYLTFKGLNLVDKVLLFDGEVVTPFNWDEGKRTLSITILSKLEETEAGFSMEEGDFPNIPEEALGKAWPLVFGQVCHVPAVQIRASRRGYLLSGEGIHDFTLHPRICQATNIQCPSANAGSHDTYTQGPDNDWKKTTDTYSNPSSECVNRRFGEICKLKDLLSQQMAYEHPTLSINNGVSFPQSTVVTIWIDGAKFKGLFMGNTFTVIDRKHPEYDDFNHVQCQSIASRYYSQTMGHVSDKWKRDTNDTGDPNTSYKYDGNVNDAFTDCDAALVRTLSSAGGPSGSWAAYDAMDSSDFFWMAAGTEVFMEGESELLFIASIIPATIDKVAAYRTYSNGKKLLVEVPTSYYTVYQTDYNGYQVMEIGMDKKLSLIDKDFGDKIYVSMTSTIGPNVADIIEWLVGKYTKLSVDTSSFASVKAHTLKYPCNFALLNRKNVYDVIKDLAYQNRCAVYIRNNIIYLVYLPIEPTSVKTIDESDIVLSSFTEELSPTDNIITTHKITWQKSGARVRSEDALDFKINLKYNVGKYGTHVKSWDYYTQNTYDTVLKSATFWLIRKSSSWKILKFKVPIKHIDLDVNDAITVDVGQFSSTPVKCIITSTQYSPTDNTIQIKCWTPIRSGETSQYYWAWPSQQSPTAKWPLPGDTNGGAGYTFSVTPPVGHILLGGSNTEDQIIMTTGDLNPSDLDDTLPMVDCLTSDLIDFNETPPDIQALEVAQSTSREAMDQSQGGGGGGGSGNKGPDQPDPCGHPAPGGCGYAVTLFYHTSTSEGASPIMPCGGPCKTKGGCPSCNGLFWSVCHTFGTAWGAQAFFDYNQSKIHEIGDYWNFGQTDLYNVYRPILKQSDNETGKPCALVGTSAPNGSPNSDYIEFGTGTDSRDT